MHVVDQCNLDIDFDYVEELTQLLVENLPASLVFAGKKEEVELRNKLNNFIEKSGLNFIEKRTPNNSTAFRRFDYSHSNLPKYFIPTGTNLAGIVPPKNLKEVDQFFLNTIFHPHLPIYTIVPLLASVTNVDATQKEFKADCFNYMLQDLKTEYFETKIKKIEHTDEPTNENNETRFNSIVRSCICVKNLKTGEDRELEVIILPVFDGKSIELFDILFAGDLGTAADIFIKSKANPVAFHCAAGQGRTGHALLTYLILHYYSSIIDQRLFQLNVSERDNQEAFENTKNNLVNSARYLRKFSPQFLATKEQLRKAIENAIIIHKFLEQYYSFDLQKEVNYTETDLETSFTSSETLASSESESESETSIISMASCEEAQKFSCHELLKPARYVLQDLFNEAPLESQEILRQVEEYRKDLCGQQFKTRLRRSKSYGSFFYKNENIQPLKLSTESQLLRKI